MLGILLFTFSRHINLIGPSTHSLLLKPLLTQRYILFNYLGGGGGGLKMVPFAIFGAENWYNMNSDHKKAKI